jgi:hypothetical protein
MKNLTIDENLILGKNSFILQDSLILILNTEKVKNYPFDKPSFLRELLQDIDANNDDI